MQFTGKNFGSPAIQWEILSDRRREDIIQRFAWNDPNGVSSDADSAAKGRKPMALEQARASMGKAIAGSSAELKLSYSTWIDFEPDLPANADEETSQEWLRNDCRPFGLGFQPDTPAFDYKNWEGLPLPLQIVISLDDWLDRAYEIIRDEVLCTICAEIGEEMLAGLVCKSDAPSNRCLSVRILTFLIRLDAHLQSPAPLGRLNFCVEV